MRPLLLVTASLLAALACGIEVDVAPAGPKARDAGRQTDEPEPPPPATEPDAEPEPEPPTEDATPSCVPALPSLVAWWQANEDLMDSHGDLDGVVGGGSAMTYAEGVVGSAFAFDGTRYVQIASPELDFHDAFSLEAWVWVEGDGRLLDRHYANTTLGFTLDVFAGRLRFVVGDGNDGGVAPSLADDAALPARTWVFVAATRGPAGTFLYVNGVEVARMLSGAPVVSAGAFRVGAGSNLDQSIASPFVGRIDQVSVYSAQLTAKDVANQREDSKRRCP